MGVVFQTSFDHYTDLTHRFNSSSSSGGGPVISAGNGRNSTASMRHIGDAAAFVSKTLPAAYSQLYFAFAYRSAGLPTTVGIRTIAEMRDSGSLQCALVLRSDGTLQVLHASGAVLGTLTDFAMLINTFYHIEWYLKIDNSTGATAVRINDVTKLNVTGGLDTQNTVNSTANVIRLVHAITGIGAVNINTDFDDVVVRDDTWSGDAQVKAFLPTGTGASDQWTAINAATTREAVDEAAPNSDTDYATASTVSYLSLWTYGSIPATSTIDAVVPMPFAKKTDSGTAKFKSVVRYSGVNYPGVEQAPSDGSYEYHPDILMTNPGTGVTWTAAGWNTPIEIGVERTA